MTNLNGLNTDKKSDPTWQKINSGHDTEELQINGYERSYICTFVTYVTYLLTLGILRLFFHWYPHLQLYATYRKCPLSRATRLLLIDDYQGKYKTYSVKDIRVIGTKNLRSPEMLKRLGNPDPELVTSIEGKKLSITLENGTKRDVLEYRAFWFKKQCYIWDEIQNEFAMLVALDKYVPCTELHLGFNKGLSKEEQLLRRIVYGKNEIIVPLQGIMVLLLLEVFNPFYMFQVFTLAVWFADGYYYYTAAIILMSLFGISSSILQTRRNQKNLHGTVASTEMVRVRRSCGTFDTVSSAELVPGDVIELPRHQGTVVCDAVLLTGHCILNESMLTGESVPVTKTPLTPKKILYDRKECSQHTLYSGTIIIQTRFYGDGPVLARVIRTGLQTNRGALVAAILYPPPADFKFDQDSYKFIGILAVISFLGFVYTVVTKASRGVTASYIAIKALDVITIVIPPALPAAMTVGKLYAQARLKKAQIYCINSRVINVSGSINCICFDKTGTLTEDGLDMWGVVPNTDASLQEAEKDIPKLRNHAIFEGMLVCHSLTLINDQLCGDPLDVKMFESTGWILEEPDVEDTSKYDLLAPTVVKPPEDSSQMFTENMNQVSEIGIIQQYQFSSSLQRMSTVVKVLGTDHFRIYTKGSPEMILSLSKPETIPVNIVSELQKYTEQGYRVIAIGRGFITSNFTKIQKMHRDQIERDLEFLGLVILENRLKEPTIRVIEELREANIQILMITGDNIQTAVSVAKECKILERDETVINVTIIPSEQKADAKIYFNVQGVPAQPTLRRGNLKINYEAIERGFPAPNYRFALTGQTWQLLREHYPELVPKICVRGAVFARMTSDQKQQLVSELMQLGYYVAMCGDGANDCGALRAAHAGISLSEAESSVASPFTSRIPDITCVPKVIRQGRAALVTSFGIFKFMVTCALTEFLSTIILYSIDSNLTDIEFLFIDICLIVNFAFFFGKTQAYAGKLASHPPMTSILSFTPLTSLILQMSIMSAFQAVAFFGVQQFAWFTPFVSHELFHYTSYENYSVFSISMFQYITTAVIFSRGKPYRRAIYTNNSFICSIIALTGVCAYITLRPAQWIVQILQLQLPPNYDWPLIILAMALANFLICLFVEMFIIDFVIERKAKAKFYQPEKSRKEYLRVMEELKAADWPKLSRDTPVLPLTPSVENVVDVRAGEEQDKVGVDNMAFVDDEESNVTKF
ncbi:polyamine-transporting ATPase 13A3-like isoform X1 [Diachasmimorpha longicaudata]|uniref:polyamine-transporting ATPase 13A3-like isoform X1 n=2 Tax=Diachasmimorpha longicaudata TaxID=58733 RepID=UPI0030B87503